MTSKITFGTGLIAGFDNFRALLEGCAGKYLPGFSVHVCGAPPGPGEIDADGDSGVLVICLGEREALCGPLYRPGRSVCPGCLTHWIANNYFDREGPAEVAGAAFVERLWEAVAEWSERLRSGGRVEELEFGAVSLEYEGAGSAWHPIFGLRDCPRCRGLSAPGVDRQRVHCSRWTGIVNRMEASEAPVAGAFRATAWWTPPAPVRQARPYLKRQDAYGRGRTREEAEAGCVGEAIERYSLIYRGDEAMVRARASEIDSIPPGDILRFSETQYREREQWNAAAEEEFQVWEKFVAGAPADWLRAEGLGREKSTRFVPAACCLMWYEFARGEAEFARADTVGCGAGRSFQSALAHALLEWVERDAMAIWWENRVRRPGVRIESFESRELEETAEGLRRIGRDLHLLDCTTDIGIPAYVSVAARLDGTEPLFAGAADLSPRAAAMRAATEVGQVWWEAKRSGALAGSMRRWLLEETTIRQPYLSPEGLIDAGAEEAIPAEERLNCIVGRLESAGLRAYAVNHSRSDVAWPVARAIVPGARHIWNRRGPGRLYEVPVKLGWKDRPTEEAGLNPIRCMI